MYPADQNIVWQEEFSLILIPEDVYQRTNGISCCWHYN